MQSLVETKVFHKITDYRIWRNGLEPDLEARPIIGFVPTMGALHDGHATLIRKARKECRHVVVSIFVNPLQFGPNEDFDRYPRAFENDLKICRDAGVDAVFHPGVDEIYLRPLSDTTKVVPPAQLVERLCGLFRPGHFEGVATVVMKLFGIVEPTIAYFGEKDYQQLAIVRRMTDDLNFPTTVVGVPTVRESDGLAMSSRNVYLTETERQAAPALYKAIVAVRDESLSGSKPLPAALADARKQLESVPGLSIQYLEACHADSLEPLSSARKPMVVLVAAKLGAVRLIDNVAAR